jgi:5-deoxy-glucuronate isomerase
MKRYFPKNSERQRITPEIAGWEFTGLTIIEVNGGVLEIPDDLLAKSEGALIPLNLENSIVKVDHQSFELEGRPGVFAGATDWIYLAPQSKVRIESSSVGEFALGTAIAPKVFPSAYLPKSEIIEIRGAGSATREIRPFMHPDHFPHAVKLNAVEVITPDGNTSSYPPHRHDGIAECPFHNEEIYYFRVGEVGGLHGSRSGFGTHRTYSAPEDPDYFDETVTVKDGDIYLVDRGYHGPSTAMPGYPMYYLNLLAGPHEQRSMGFCDDPEHKNIRESWKDQSPDPRIPWRIGQ